jgi:hypothetical protein
MKKAFITILPVLVIALSSCKECPCAPGQLKFDLIGFSDAEADTFIIRKFEANGNFNIKQDTFLIDHVGTVRFQDTLKIVAYPGTALLPGGFDYEIFFPYSNSVFRITEINERMSTQRCGGLFATDKVGCANTITSIKLDGNIVNPWPFNDFYIRK